MVFRNFDRLLFAASETTPGTAATITTSTDFIEAIEPTFTITPLQFERFQKSQTQTTQTQTVPGTAKSAPVGTCEISFGVELAGPGTAVASGTAPDMSALLKACGLSQIAVYKYDVTATTYSGGPFYHLENIEGSAGAYSSPDAKSFGCNAYGDAEFLALSAGALGNVAIKSEHSGATATATGTAATQIGMGYVPAAIMSDDLNGSAVTLRLYLGNGAYVQAKGCKGTFDIAFTHGDRAVLNFTFSGVLNNYTESGSTPADHSYTAEVPPAWINTGLKMQADTDNATAYWEGALLNSMTFTMGNEITVREDTNDASGYHIAIITGRSPQLTFNPDAVLASGNYDMWDKFLSGSPTKMRWSVGSTAGNRMDFRVTSAQFTGVADGDRDSVSILDSTTMLTGGSFGSSIVASGGDPSGSTFGSDNEFQILFR